MKTFAVLSLAAMATAQFSYNVKDRTFTCTKKSGVAAYCAGGDIIIRCQNGYGSTSSCNNDLAGQKPYGNNLAGCFQTSPTSGDAACTKAGMVYPATGAGDSKRSSPYPVPKAGNAAKKAPYITGTGTAIRLIPTGTASPYQNTTMSEPKWSNTTITSSATVMPIPQPTLATSVYSSSTTVATVAPTPTATRTSISYTGDAASGMSQTAALYWAFGVLAAVAIL